MTKMTKKAKKAKIGARHQQMLGLTEAQLQSVLDAQELPSTPFDAAMAKLKAGRSGELTPAETLAYAKHQCETDPFLLDMQIKITISYLIGLLERALRARKQTKKPAKKR